MRGAVQVTFAAILLLIVGTLNVIYGIGALDSTSIFVDDQWFIFDSLNTVGCVLIVVGAIQFTGGLSLIAGNIHGRVIGITGAGLGAIGALLSIGRGDPWWSPASFVRCVWVVRGIFVLGRGERALAS